MYSLKLGLGKFVKYAVVLGLVAGVQYFIGSYPVWADVTVGALLLALVNLVKTVWGVKLP